jgi:hypothetical protein
MRRGHRRGSSLTRWTMAGARVRRVFGLIAVLTVVSPLVGYAIGVDEWSTMDMHDLGAAEHALHGMSPPPTISPSGPWHTIVRTTISAVWCPTASLAAARAVV